MKKCIILASVLMSLFSCREKEVELFGPHIQFTVMFIPIDAYGQEFSYYRNPKSIGLFFRPSQQENWSYELLQNYRFVDEEINQKEQLLANTFIKYGYDLEFGVGVGGVFLPIMYGGISGPVRVYSDNNVAGKEPGEDLSEFLNVITLGRIVYPEMELVDDESHGYEKEVSYFAQPFSEYFSFGTVPGFDSPNFTVVFPENMDDSTTLYFEIPVTGVTSSGEEKTVVFTCECPGK